MKEDLEISRANSMALMQENAILKAQRNHKQNLKAKQQVTQILILSSVTFVEKKFVANDDW